MYLDKGGKGSGEPKVNRCAKRPRTSLRKALPTRPTQGWIQPRMQNTFSAAPLDPHAKANINGLH